MNTKDKKRARVPASRLQITLDALRELGCSEITYGKEVA